MSKRSDLFREYARVIDLCEGTNANPQECVRYDGIHSAGCQMTFTGDCDLYTFALAIVEDRPVFAGDVLWSTWLKSEVTITGIHEPEDDSNVVFLAHYSERYPTGNTRIANLTWTKPDPFAELLKAKAKGERIVFYDGAKWVDTDVIDMVNFKPESYMVVAHDSHKVITQPSPFNGRSVEVNWKLCGITGKISAEVVE